MSETTYSFVLARNKKEASKVGYSTDPVKYYYCQKHHVIQSNDSNIFDLRYVRNKHVLLFAVLAKWEGPSCCNRRVVIEQKNPALMGCI